MGKGPSRKKKRTADAKTETAPDHPVLAEDPFSESVIESLPGLFWVLDDRGRYVRWNKNLESALGYAAEEIAYQHANFLVHPDYRSHVLKGIDRCFGEGHASIEYELMTKSGRRSPPISRTTCGPMIFASCAERYVCCAGRRKRYSAHPPKRHEPKHWNGPWGSC